MTTYDAVLVLSFGGPEREEDVLPFLENVVRGKRIPRERLLQAAQHYYHLGGRSPINDQNRALIAALEAELAKRGPRLPVYWGNRNWHPLLPDTLRKMKQDGVSRAMAFVTSAYSSYSGCRQYLEDIERARREIGGGAPVIDKLRTFHNHPAFIGALISRISEAFSRLPDVGQTARLIYTAHSIPLEMAGRPRYEAELQDTCSLVSNALGISGGVLVYQSRSGPPSQPWLEPDILEYLRELPKAGVSSVVIAPVGFLSDHVEVLYDLDTEAKALCNSLGVRMERAATVGCHPQFVSMIRELILERLEPGRPRRFLGLMRPSADDCDPGCCLPPCTKELAEA